ncbi:hypothetical protein [Hyphobacterium sp.]|uniref:hypothetical protein n=1 Tax=Hyphobacterium sp. TaxID=2004662 RepID=UPI003748E642
MPISELDVKATLIKEFSDFQKLYEYAYADTVDPKSDSVIYTHDFDLLYPYIFGIGKESKEFDILGQNIFTLGDNYFSNAGYSTVFTIPSLLELLDALDHRYERMNRLINSRIEVQKLKHSLSNLNTIRGENNASDFREILIALKALKASDASPNLIRLISMFENRKVSLLHDHIDPSGLHNSDFYSARFEAIFESMYDARSKRDNREEIDKRFHYTVDSWNIELSIRSTRMDSVQIDHVCRPGISRFFPDDFRAQCSRHPYVPMIKLYSLYRASSDGDIIAESASFIRHGIKSLHNKHQLLSDPLLDNLSALTEYEKDDIDRVYNEYIRPLRGNYGQSKLNISGDDLASIIEKELAKYDSVTTEKGLRERFEYNAVEIKRSAHTFVESHPELIDEKILGQYSLDECPRVNEIRKNLGLS